MEYLVLKIIHILSATLLFGTGLGSVFYFWRANQSTDLKVRLVTADSLVLADWLFTTPAVILQLATGLRMAMLLGYSTSTHWLVIAILLFLLAGVCWIPVVWLQIKMRDLLKTAIRTQQPLPTRYKDYQFLWLLLGWPAFIAVLVIFYLMIFKPW